MADIPAMATLELKKNDLPDGTFADVELSDEFSDPAAEERLVRKLDRHIIPIVMLLYLLSFLDRWVWHFHRVQSGQRNLPCMTVITASISEMPGCMAWKQILVSSEISTKQLFLFYL